MDDLERAIVFSFDQSGKVDAPLRAQAMAYCEQSKGWPNILQVCLERFASSPYAEVQFWCLQTLEGLLRLRYSALDPQERFFLQTSLMSALCNSCRLEDEPVFVKNKLAQIIAMLIYVDYPAGWPSIFLDLLGSLSKGPSVVDMFCRVLTALDEEVISLDYPREADEISIATRIKDAMRQQCVAQIVAACYNLVATNWNVQPNLVASVLEALRRLISWIDIGLVANDAFISLLFELVISAGEPTQLRIVAADCVLAIVSKRMDGASKLSLLQQLQIGRICSCIAQKQEPDFALKLTSLLTGFASELLESSRKLSPADPATKLAEDALDTVLPPIFYFVHHGDEDIFLATFPFLSSYISGMKNMNLLRRNQVNHIQQVLEVIENRMRYDPSDKESLDEPDKLGKEEEERMAQYRKELISLFRCIHRFSPDIAQSFVQNRLSAIFRNPNESFEVVEATITLFYNLGEGMNEDALKPGGGAIEEMVGMFLSGHVPSHSHRLVSLAYLDTVIRFVRFALYHTEFIPAILQVLIDKRGIHHPNPNVSGRASYLFLRFVKVLRAHLLPFLETVLQNLGDVLVSYTSLKISINCLVRTGFEDGSHIFEALGLLIGLEDLPQEKQTEFLSTLLLPLCKQVDTLLSSNPVPARDLVGPPGTTTTLQQVIVSISSLSKGFGEHLATSSRPTIGAMFKQTLDVLLRILVVFPNNKILRSKIVSFLHRMVETLGSDVLPFLPTVIQQLLADYEPKEMAEFVILINQLLNKFKSGMHDILQDLLPYVVTRIFSALPKGMVLESPGSNTEEIRELKELERVYFSFLQAVISNELSSVLLAPQSAQLINNIMQSVLEAACNHKDALVRKICVQIYIKLIKDWCGTCSEEEKVPGFRRFIIETFATKCCVYSVLDQLFDLRDANTFSLFGEIVAAQKTIYEKCGDEFLVYLATNVLPATHCPQNMAQQYCLHIQHSELKDLKSFYKSLVERLKPLQNGNTVFR